jgi:hypothetical protein
MPTKWLKRASLRVGVSGRSAAHVSNADSSHLADAVDPGAVDPDAVDPEQCTTITRPTQSNTISIDPPLSPLILHHPAL